MNKILKIDINSLQVLYVYNSLAEAARDCGLTTSAISKALKRDNNYAGHYYWCLEKNYVKDWVPKKLCKAEDGFNPLIVLNKVLCVENNMTFKTFTEAAEFLNCNRQGIARCCLGQQKTCGGYHWKLIKVGENSNE